MWEELTYVFRSVTQNSEARVAIISGAGRGFCSGADLNEAAWRGETLSKSRSRIERNNQQLAREMIACPIPIIAAVNGYALGGGVEIALAADLRIAGETAKFGFPEAKIGRFISGGASLLLPRIIGMSWAKRMIFTGEHIHSKYVQYHQVKQISLKPDSNEILNVDGELKGTTPLSIEVNSKKLCIYN